MVLRKRLYSYNLERKFSVEKVHTKVAFLKASTREILWRTPPAASLRELYRVTPMIYEGRLACKPELLLLLQTIHVDYGTDSTTAASSFLR